MVGLIILVFRLAYGTIVQVLSALGLNELNMIATRDAGHRRQNESD